MYLLKGNKGIPFSKVKPIGNQWAALNNRGIAVKGCFITVMCTWNTT